MPEYYKTINGEGTFDYEDFYAAVATRLPEGCTAVEVGVASGRSAVYLAEALSELCKGFLLRLVDDLSYGGESQRQEIEGHLAAVRPRLSGSLQLQVGASVETAAQYADRSLDFVFIDGDHGYESVRDDIAAWLPKVKLGGLLAGHDYRIPSVRAAVVERFGELPAVPTRDGWQVWSYDVV